MWVQVNLGSENSDNSDRIIVSRIAAQNGECHLPEKGNDKCRSFGMFFGKGIRNFGLLVVKLNFQLYRAIQGVPQFYIYYFKETKRTHLYAELWRCLALFPIPTIFTGGSLSKSKLYSLDGLLVGQVGMTKHKKRQPIIKRKKWMG